MSERTTERYPGSRSFRDTDLDRLLFWGRKTESSTLFHKILANDLVLFYGKSGIGKTSLLNAGVAAKLREAELVPVLLRLNLRDRDPIELVQSQFRQRVAEQGFEVAGPNDAIDHLWTFFQRTEVWRKNVLLTPVLVFDQFEELFTLWDEEGRNRLIRQFADLARKRPPQETDAADEAPLAPSVKMIVSLREDYLGELEAVAAEVPQIMHNRFRLTAFSREQAREAIREPARVQDSRIPSKAFSYEDGAIEELLDFLGTRRERRGFIRGKEVEAFQLQILCQHIESKIRTREDAAGTELTVASADLGGEEGMRSILRDFYTRIIESLPTESRRAVRSLCEEGLISETEKRLSLEEEDIHKRFDVAAPTLAELVAVRLLRAEPRLGSTYYELSHDTLVAPILLDRQERDPEKLMSQASEAMFQGDSWKAQGIYERILEIAPGYVAAYLRLSDALVAAGRVPQAHEVLKRAAENVHQNPAVHHRLARILREERDYKEAVASFERAVELNPNLPEIYLDFGETLLEWSERPQPSRDPTAAPARPTPATPSPIDLRARALEVYRKALELDPKDTRSYQQIAAVHAHNEDFDEVASLYATAVERDHTLAFLFENLLAELKKEKDPAAAAAARSICRTASAVEEQDANYYFRVAYEAFEFKAIDAAGAAYERSLELSEDPVTFNNLALVRLEQRPPRVDEAEALYRKALAAAPGTALYYRNLGDLLRERTNRWDEAQEAYEKALEIDPNYVWAVNGLALLYKARTEPDEAERLFRKAMELAPEEALLLRNLGDLLREQAKRWDEAQKAYEKALEINPDHVWAVNGLGLLYKARKEPDEAERLFRKAMGLAPEEALLQRNLGDLLREQTNRWDEAQKAYEQALEIDPDHVWAVNGLGLLYKERKEPDEAERLFRKAMGLAPEEALLWQNLGDLLREQTNRWDEAQKAYEKALEIDPGYVWALNGLALLFQARKEPDEAERLFRRAMTIAPEEALLQRNLGGLLHEQTNRWDEAQKAYEKALEIDPSFAWAKSGLAFLRQAQEEFGEAERLLREAAEAAPGEPLHRAQLGNFLFSQNREDEGEAVLRDAIREHPDSPHAYNGLAWALREKKARLPEALNLSAKAIERMPTSPEILHTHAEIAVRLDHPDALAAIEAWIRLSPPPWPETQEAVTIETFRLIRARGKTAWLIHTLRKPESRAAWEKWATALEATERPEAAAELDERTRAIHRAIVADGP